MFVRSSISCTPSSSPLLPPHSHSSSSSSSARGANETISHYQARFALAAIENESENERWLGIVCRSNQRQRGEDRASWRRNRASWRSLSLRVQEREGRGVARRTPKLLEVRGGGSGGGAKSRTIMRGAAGYGSPASAASRQASQAKPASQASEPSQPDTRYVRLPLSSYLYFSYLYTTNAAKGRASYSILQ